MLNVAAKGSVRVGIANKDGRRIPGFAVSDCKPIKADSVRHQVSWQGGSDVAKLAGKTVRLVFEMKDARLYSLQFID